MVTEVIGMNERIKVGYEAIAEFYGDDTAKETLAEYERYEEDWRELAGSNEYPKFEPVALPLLKWSYLHTVRFSEVLERLDSVKELRWKYRALSILPEPDKLTEALLLAANVGGDRIVRNGDWITVLWDD